MARYFTHTTMYSRHWGKPGSFEDVPAVLFFDSAGDLPFPDALAGIREYVKFAPIPMQYRSHIGNNGVAWLFSSVLRLPPPTSVKDWRTEQNAVLVQNIQEDPHVKRPIGSAAVYGSCIQLTRAMEGCPCTLAKDYDGGRDGIAPSVCEQTTVFKALDLVPPETLMRHRASIDGWHDVRTLTGFQQIGPAYISENRVGAAVDYPERYDLREASIEGVRGEYKAAAQAAADTRKATRSKCAACVFSVKRIKGVEPQCPKHARTGCSGTRTYEDILKHYARNVPKKLFGTFSVEDRNKLILIASADRTYEARIPGISCRKTHVRLGYFTAHGSFRVFAGKSDKSRYVDYFTAEELYAAVPDAADVKPPAADIPEWVFKAYGAVLNEDRRPRKNGWHGTTEEYIQAIYYTPYGNKLDVGYGRHDGVNTWSHVELKETNWAYKAYNIKHAEHGYRLPQYYFSESVSE